MTNLQDEATMQLQNGQGHIPGLDTVLTSQKTQILKSMLYNLSKNNYELSLSQTFVTQESTERPENN
jgi:hypothetical protein